MLFRSSRGGHRSTSLPARCAPGDSNHPTCGLRIRCSTVELGAPGQPMAGPGERQRAPATARRYLGAGIRRPYGSTARRPASACIELADRWPAAGSDVSGRGRQSQLPRQPGQRILERLGPEQKRVGPPRCGQADLHPCAGGQFRQALRGGHRLQVALPGGESSERIRILLGGEEVGGIVCLISGFRSPVELDDGLLDVVEIGRASCRETV